MEAQVCFMVTHTVAFTSVTVLGTSFFFVFFESFFFLFKVIYNTEAYYIN